MYYINLKQEKILDVVKKFGGIGYEHLKKLTNIKDLDRQLKSLLKQNRIEVIYEGIYVLKGQNKIDEKMVKALDLYVYLINDMKLNVKACIVEDFPFKLAFLKDNKVFDAAVISEGEEIIYSGAIDRSLADRIIIILDREEQVQKTKLNKMVKYCTVKQGAVNFFEKVSEIDE